MPKSKTQIAKMDRAKEQFIENLRASGNVKLSARAVGYTYQRAYQWRDEDPAFAEEWREAIEESISILEAEARRRAINGVKRSIFYQGEEVGVETRYSDTLLMFLLKAHRPDMYRDNVENAADGEGQSVADLMMRAREKMKVKDVDARVVDEED